MRQSNWFLSSLSFLKIQTIWKSIFMDLKHMNFVVKEHKTTKVSTHFFDLRVVCQWHEERLFPQWRPNLWKTLASILFTIYCHNIFGLLWEKQKLQKSFKENYECFAFDISQPSWRCMYLLSKQKDCNVSSIPCYKRFLDHKRTLIHCFVL
jgi:hypothetical protein